MAAKLSGEEKEHFTYVINDIHTYIHTQLCVWHRNNKFANVKFSITIFTKAWKLKRHQKFIFQNLYFKIYTLKKFNR